MVVVSPVLLVYWIVTAASRNDRAFESCSQLLATIPGLPGQYLRRAFFAQTMAAIGPDTVISFGAILSASGTRIGDGAYIGPYCTIGLAEIGANTLVAAGAHIPSGARTHGIEVDGAIKDQVGQRRVVRVGANVWIGNNAVVMADVGDDAVVGAGAVVTRPIPPRTVAAGVPARVIRSRDEGTVTA